MNANITNLQALYRAFKDFAFNTVFLVGLVMGLILGIIVSSIFFSTDVSPIWNIVMGFILGIAASFSANYLWEKHKLKQRGDKPYFSVQTFPDNIYYEGLAKNTASNRTAINKNLADTVSSSGQ